MVFQLQYRGTFIDIDSEPQHSKKRSSSLPARPMEDPHNNEERIHHQSYLSSLSDSAEQLRQSQLQKAWFAKQFQAQALAHKQDSETASLSTHEDSLLPSMGHCSSSGDASSVPSMGMLPDLETDHQQGTSTGTELNPGSVGHPEVCRKPCICFAAGQCSNGRDCGYCHCEHSNAGRGSHHLDKRQREMIQNLSDVQLLQLIVKPMRKRVESMGFQVPAVELLHVTEQRLADLQHCQDPVRMESSPVPHKMLSRLSRLLEAVPLSDLCGILKKNLTDGPTTELVWEALTNLREAMAKEQQLKG
mmetsp:Transcript_81384/g.143651  ORF Transcript_81384/g.143651 Transcript_81384/m.143651 type:complete len:303 (+) Transcript_81384:65-973(+)|eukprot:CAMPEP_0197655414 /NCGR_PEP_ID=MMETSP1338-20131121/39439_1 /TAXON_ID=43686 ORGANISM="Pelagodinium beii, Strain RCC1491" /NCGR_SAMPLE_ID=MMETSP1338 /ASSEMBLY_ACC=CAM_ASM_000754 /LENGTH=302 /DNA_ID=CAMNT_0043231053 /DNA_START=66 /DNA_END=974 /DNA_ORIENTATION=-